MSSGSQQLWNHLNSVEDADAAQNENVLACNEEGLFSPETFFDLPPESFWVPKSHEKDWVDDHAIMQRKSSMKLSFIGSSKQNSSSSGSKSFSQRFSPSPNQKSKASLIGLPKTQKFCLVDGYCRHINNKGGNARLFRSRSEPGGKLVLDVPEPGSPKVSCTGRVEKEKRRGKRAAGLWMSFKTVLKTGFRANILAHKEDNTVSV